MEHIEETEKSEEPKITEEAEKSEEPEITEEAEKFEELEITEEAEKPEEVENGENEKVEKPENPHRRRVDWRALGIKISERQHRRVNTADKQIIATADRGTHDKQTSQASADGKR